MNEWAERAKTYENISWAKEETYLKTFLEATRPKKTDILLDCGTGTARIAALFSPFVKKVVALDISKDMLSVAKTKIQGYKNMHLIKGNILNIPFPANSFDKITARMVFHHIKEQKKALDECHRVLKPKGLFIFSEGIPPHPSVKNFYTAVSKFLEDRVDYTEEDIYNFLKGNFDNISMYFYTTRLSINNWLSNHALPKNTQEEIVRMYRDAEENIKKAYDMEEKNGDILVTGKFNITTAVKV